MSLLRLIYWSALIGAWAAFVGWLFAELALHWWIHNFFVAILMATLVAIPIGGGVSVAHGLSNPKIDVLLKRLVLGFAGGFAGGLLGTLMGSCIFVPFGWEALRSVEFIGRTLGFALIGVGIGAGIGVSEGIIDRSFKKLRNGLIGGVLGGFLGGIFFYPVSRVASDISSRAFSFVLLGLFVGFFIGLAQVILKEAWLTVEAGFRAGRQMILGKDVVTMGTSEKSSLIFIAYGAKGVEPIHLKITRQESGAYVLEDNQSRTGTMLNGKPIAAVAQLADGDLIQFGVNIVRFNERAKHGDAQRLPEPNVIKPTTKSASSEAIQASAPGPVPAPAVTAKLAAPKSEPILPKPAAASKPAATAPQPQEGRCPICDKKIVGIPGERRCTKCFTTF